MKQFSFMLGILAAVNFIVLAFDAGFLLKPDSQPGSFRNPPVKQPFQKASLPEEQPFQEENPDAEDAKSIPVDSPGMDQREENPDAGAPDVSKTGSFPPSPDGEMNKLEHFLRSAREIVEEIKMSSKTRIEGLPSDKEFIDILKTGPEYDDQVEVFLIRLSEIYDEWGYDFPDSLFSRK